MGFAKEDVVSHESHYSEFVCAVCQDLAEDPLLTECGHVFCLFCENEWRQRFRGGIARCPSCNKNLRTETATLSAANPLAARILGRVRVKCPLRVQACKWEGDYSEVQAHLVNSSEHLGDDTGTATPGRSQGATTTTTTNNNNDNNNNIASGGQRDRHPEKDGDGGSRATADALKAQGDAKYAAKSYAQAAALYDKAIGLAPSVASYYSNRSACKFMLADYRSCVRDCDTILRTDKEVYSDDLPSSTVTPYMGDVTEAMMAKAAIRRSKARVELSDFDQGGIQELVAVLSRFMGSSAPQDKARRLVEDAIARLKTLDMEVRDGQRSLVRGDFWDAAAHFGRVLRDTSAAMVVVHAAAAEVGLGRIDRALSLTLQVLRRSDAGEWRGAACFVRGAALVLQDTDVDAGLGLLREAVRMDPDDGEVIAVLRAAKRARTTRDEAKCAMNHRDFDVAARRYTDLIDTQLTASTSASSSRPSGDEVEEEEDHRRRLVEMPRRGLALPSFGSLASRSPLCAAALAERANCELRAGRPEASLADAARSLAVKDDGIDAWLTRTAALRKLGRHDAAVRDLRLLMDQWGAADVRIRHAYEAADFDARRAKRPRYYDILGCRHVSTEREIKNAYRAKSLDHHPDRHATASDASKKLHEEQFKDLGEALEILGDPQRRALYDEGFDKAAIDERIAAAQRATQNPHAGHHHHHHA